MDKEEIKQNVSIKKNICMKEVDNYIMEALGFQIGDKLICETPSGIITKFIYNGIENEYIIGDIGNNKEFRKIWWYLIDYIRKEE